MKKPLLISACLTGLPCRYDGRSRPVGRLSELAETFDLIPVCPETAGGLGVPRDPCELVRGAAKTKDGRDCTSFYRKGAEVALKCAKDHRCHLALLKEKSPSCGTHCIYDGTFSETLIPGSGITARLLAECGVQVFSEDEIDLLLS